VRVFYAWGHGLPLYIKDKRHGGKAGLKTGDAAGAGSKVPWVIPV